MGDPTRFYFILSGEHPTLPLAELKAILEAHEISFKIMDSFYKLIELTAQPHAVRAISGRGGFTDESGIEIFHSSPSTSEIDDALRSSEVSRYLSARESFSVRVLRFGGVSKGESRVRLEAHLGGILAKETGAKINLKNPQKLFRGILGGPYFHLGVVAYQRPIGSIAVRRPRKRPAFHPSTMMPKLARCMVNLSKVVKGTSFLDPFCGVGGILIEASLLGCETIGMDAIKKMLRGSRRNLRHFGMIPLGLLRGDARNLPLKAIEAIATDPPYGTGASTLRSTTRNILRDFLPEAQNILPNGRRLVIASPVGTGTTDMAESAGFSIADHHEVYVHRRLTREILVLEAR